MKNTRSIIDLDWPRIAAELDEEGAALLPGLLTAEHLIMLRQHARAAQAQAQRAQGSLPGLASGEGPIWQPAETLPAPFPAWHRMFHQSLMPIAERWNARMGATSSSRQAEISAGRVTFSHLQAGGDEALHQHADGAHAFPLQLAILLSSPGQDFTGGEFVMTEQRPRMQSRPMVLPLAAGDAAIIATSRRPVRGAHGDYQVNLAHAISRVRTGERLGMEWLFHDAAAAS